MEAVLTAEQMRAADAAVIASGTSSDVLVERAGYAVAIAAMRMLGRVYGSRVVVVVGKGNNGADGRVAARHLGSAGAGVVIARPGEALPPADLVIDAVLGTGARGEPREPALSAIAAINAHPAPVLAVDVASAGRVRADVTLAIQALKSEHLKASGIVDVADIGIAIGRVEAWVPGASDVAAQISVRDSAAHKYSAGAAAVCAGAEGMSGAAVLAIRGAQAAGAGIVFAGVPSEVLSVVEALVMEAVKIGLPSAAGRLDASSVKAFAPQLERASALAMGPGIGLGDAATGAVRAALDTALPLVIDADALAALAAILHDDASVLHRRGAPVIITPHLGEYRRLPGAADTGDAIADAKDMAARIGAIVHLKGPRAVTATPSGDAWVNPTGTSLLATAGSGDVLTGITAGLLAQGNSAATAMWAAAYLHGLAAHGAAAGRASIVAGDIVRQIPFAALAVRCARPRTGPIRRVFE